MMAALDRPDGDGIGHQPRLGARLDLEKPTDLFQHRHSLTVERVARSLEPFAP
jgi:hypothetical protein